MRFSGSLPAILVASWLATSGFAFVVVVGDVRRAMNRKYSSHRSSSRSGAVVARPYFGVGATPAPILKRISCIAMTMDGEENEVIRTPNVMDCTSPEDIMKRMSIPDLAQKLDTAEKTYGQVHPQIAAALIPLSQALYANGDFAPARETCVRALQVLQSAYGETPKIEVAECLHTLAMIQQKENPEIGDIALGSQNMALELAMRVGGPESIEVAAYSRCLAQMSEDYSKYLTPGLPRPCYMPNPVPLYRQTLRILEKVVGPDHPEVASALDDVASALLFWREDMTKEVTTVSMLPEAETLASRALDISRGSLGVEHPITAGREHNLGMIQRGLGREDEARGHFQQALSIREKALGADHPATKSSRELVEESEGASTEP